jgi:hypothetical protein
MEMAKMSYSYVDDIEDDDPTVELEVLPMGLVANGRDEFADDPESAPPSARAANQPFGQDRLDEQLREANDRISELSSEVRERSEMMQSIRLELDRLKGFSAFLEKEVETGKGIIADVTDELISVRTEQNDVSEQLRRREQQIEILQGKLAQKDAFIEEFARHIDTGNRGGDPQLDEPKKKNGAAKPTIEAKPGGGLYECGQGQQKRLRMLVARSESGPARYPILAGEISLGTSPENDLRLEGGFVSYRHARITETAAGCVLRDLGSSNGTWINRRRVKWQILRDGDVIDIGPLRFEFIDRPMAVKNTHPEEASH